VTYTVASPADAPQTLTFGPKLFDLAATYAGRVTLGLNRRLNNIANTISAAALAKQKIGTLHAIELGNEPDRKCPVVLCLMGRATMKIRQLTSCRCTVFSSSDPIAQGSTWDAAADYRNEVQWQTYVAGNLSTTQIISAGVFLGTNDFKISGLTAVEGSANDYVKQYSSHNYPQSKNTANLPNLMKHNSITSQISQFKGEIAAANAKGRRHVFGETNSGKWPPDCSFLLFLSTRSIS
jgi:hypothetical protein